MKALALLLAVAGGAVTLGYLPDAAAAETHDQYAGLLGGVVLPDHARDADSGFTVHVLYGIGTSDNRAWELNAFTQSTRQTASQNENKATGAGLDLNWGRRKPGSLYLLTGVGAVYEQNAGARNRTNPLVDIGAGFYLPQDPGRALYRFEFRWNGISGELPGGESHFFSDFRVQLGVAFGVRRPPPKPVPVPVAASEPVHVKEFVPPAPISDQDHDGVADALDRCPDTPAWVRPDAAGCGPDADRDGVLDMMDRCPDTPAADPVDRDGCGTSQRDTDSDGVMDRDDKCPDTEHGVAVLADGCPDLGKLALTDIHFGNDADILNVAGLQLLDQVAATLRAHPEARVEIAGHADSTGSAVYNNRLAYKRAVAAREFLVHRGIEGTRLTVKSFGVKAPKASNRTEKGRAENRRVEFRLRDNAP